MIVNINGTSKTNINNHGSQIHNSHASLDDLVVQVRIYIARGSFNNFLYPALLGEPFIVFYSIALDIPLDHL